ncbi:MAG: hypothetical protein JSW03_08680 [Candidatus Eiseniibacteriota bacterium]|nr:MAG: hypothetical protein JSW03_08680 [Candidatus Eisenbacteria bacterium]
MTTGRVPTIIKRTLDRLDPNMAAVFVPWARRHPRFLPAFVRLSYAYKRSEKNRDKALKDGLMVPPLLILSITSR